MDSRALRQKITVIAQALSGQHDNPSYFRPQYFASLCQALPLDALSHLKVDICEEVATAVRKQCGVGPENGDLELLWEAFGKERVERKALCAARSSVYAAFSSMIQDSELPHEVISQALAFHSDPSLFTVRMLAITALRPAKRLYACTLSTFDSLLGLAAWKLGRKGLAAEQLRAWVLNSLHHQIRFRYKLDLTSGAEFDDVAQDALSRVLSQLCIYQPTESIRLQTWIFGSINTAISMSLRSYRQHSPEIPVGSGFEVAAVAKLTEPRADDESGSRVSALAEFAATRMPGRKRIAERERRIQVVARLVGPMLGTETAKDQDQLAEQLKTYFPSITESQISQMLEQSGLGKNETFAEQEVSK